MRIIFAGSPSFAVPSLERLLATEHEIACVITQPDRRAGRGLALKEPAIKRFARQKGLPVHQPEKFNSPEFLDVLEALHPDLIAVAAYGRIFKTRSLKMPKHGCVNLHASLLPRYRGVAPINWAIINGEAETGVTTFFMEEGVDSGDIILSQRTEIGMDENAGELTERLSVLGADLFVRTCDLIADGQAEPVKQDHSMASHAPRLSKEDGKIDLDQTAAAVHNHIRGVNPWPGAVTTLKGEPVRIGRSALADAAGRDPGRVISIDSQHGILVSCNGGSVWFKILQAQGKKAIAGADFARGHRIKIGDFFGGEAG